MSVTLQMECVYGKKIERKRDRKKRDREKKWGCIGGVNPVDPWIVK